MCVTIYLLSLSIIFGGGETLGSNARIITSCFCFLYTPSPFESLWVVPLSLPLRQVCPVPLDFSCYLLRLPGHPSSLSLCVSTLSEVQACRSSIAFRLSSLLASVLPIRARFPSLPALMTFRCDLRNSRFVIAKSPVSSQPLFFPECSINLVLR